MCHDAGHRRYCSLQLSLLYVFDCSVLFVKCLFPVGLVFTPTLSLLLSHVFLFLIRCHINETFHFR